MQPILARRLYLFAAPLSTVRASRYNDRMSTRPFESPAEVRQAVNDALLRLSQTAWGLSNPLPEDDATPRCEGARLAGAAAYLRGRGVPCRLYTAEVGSSARHAGVAFIEAAGILFGENGLTGIRQIGEAAFVERGLGTLPGTLHIDRQERDPLDLEWLHPDNRIVARETTRALIGHRAYEHTARPQAKAPSRKR